jgi:hypothetical protein
MAVLYHPACGGLSTVMLASNYQELGWLWYHKTGKVSKEVRSGVAILFRIISIVIFELFL